MAFTGCVGHRTLEGSITVAEENENLICTRIDNSQIELTIPIEIPPGHGVYPASDRVGQRRCLEGPIAIAQENGNGLVVASLRDCEVELAISIEVPRNHSEGVICIITEGVKGCWLERAIAMPSSIETVLGPPLAEFANAKSSLPSLLKSHCGQREGIAANRQSRACCKRPVAVAKQNRDRVVHNVSSREVDLAVAVEICSNQSEGADTLRVVQRGSMILRQQDS